MRAKGVILLSAHFTAARSQSGRVQSSTTCRRIMPSTARRADEFVTEMMRRGGERSR